MLNEISCWYFDWSAWGTWVGGLGTAGAAFWGVFSVRKAWQKDKDRDFKRSQVLQVLISAEIGFVSGVAKQVVEMPKFLADQAVVEYWRENLMLTYVPELLPLSGELDSDLAFTLAQAHHYVSVLDKYLERWEKGARSGDAMQVIIKAATALMKSVEKLQAEMGKVPVLSPHLKVSMDTEAFDR